MDASLHAILSRPGSITFPTNQPYLKDFTGSGGRVVRQPTGHLLFYNRQGRRILATDPDGHPLHECEWGMRPGGSLRLIQARIHLDWGAWVGIKPAGLVTETALDLSKKPGWERIRADDLRRLAARALQVPLEEVRFFYDEQDLRIDPRGVATIRHRKDALYVLDKGAFDGARFMACMAAMHWERVDFLPVVELFQSLLPGTGSAAFELIRGLYDDQTRDRPLPLRYRGIPTYPSEAAYRLFSAFFTPQIPGGGNPLPVFMDQSRSHEVTWLPAPDPPRRYIDPSRSLCITIKGDQVQKVTMGEDPTGLPFFQAGPEGPAAAGRFLLVDRGKVVLQDEDLRQEVPIQAGWGPLKESASGRPAVPVPGWRAFFQKTLPAIHPAEAFGAVLLYPEDDAEIEETATQPFVADYLQDEFEQEPALRARLAGADRILIHNFDAALLACLHLDRPRQYTVRYGRPAFAQKQAQILWNRLAQAGRTAWVNQITFVPAEAGGPGSPDVPEEQAARYELVYEWVPFAWYAQPDRLDGAAGELARVLQPGGLAFVVGVPPLGPVLASHGLRMLRSEPVDSLPTFRMHRTILPKARVKPGLTLFQATRNPA